ncbi:type I-E CRISPR-associated protein Cse2/CasB [Coraliomargarita algicola]|uniref:Type I-E CRISPR-associated protein Cse2/CasB n=1 Tax=Coraliomargarita algicola TaxID=3092156 RepID=A0ABZ0RKX8_9BACT|nr:type I-E CRISPR-associated protein Cse2/CasB [Coraliomargarita sp. J2-16]WPJ95665.1 type I-E CRISPR-associated protein Cse2/CasB [Coraliomargarita sp. J2-16]
MKKEEPKKDDVFIRMLTNMCKDRGTSAALRKYWSPTTTHYSYPILGRLRVPNHKHPDAITASLYAINPNHQNPGKSFAQACLQLAGGSIKAQAFETFEPHMLRLLASSELDELKQQLRRISIRLERAGIPINYNRLMWDLRKWAKESEDIKTAWAMHFWQAPVEQIQTETTKV